MCSRFVLLILCVAVGVVQGEVKLTKGHNETVSFKGEELIIDVDNSMGANYDLIMCFGSSPEASNQPCPLGFARLTTTMAANEKMRLTVNRRSQTFKGSETLSPLGTIQFNDDATLTIMVMQLPDAKTTVTLPNAEIFVPEMQTTAIIQKKRYNFGTAGIVAIIIVLLVIDVVVGIVVWWCITRTAKPQTLESNQQNESLPSQQFRHPKMSTLRKSSPKKPVKCASNATTTTVQMPLSPKQAIPQ